MPGYELSVASSGSPAAPLLVLLHGAGMGRWMWQPQMEPLGRAYRTLAPDLPGLGGSVASGPFSIAGAADAVIALIREQGQGAADVCGLSLGAIVALEMALRAPNVVRSLVLSGGQVHPNSVLMAVERTILALLPASALEKPPALLNKRYPDLAQAATDDMRATGKHRLLDLIGELGKIDYRQRLGEVRMPTIVLCGGRDRANLPAARMLARGIPHARLLIVSGVGHVWNLEAPDLFTDTLLTFLRQVEDAQAS